MNYQTAAVAGPSRLGTATETAITLPAMERIRQNEAGVVELQSRLRGLLDKLRGNVPGDKQNVNPSLPGMIGCLERTQTVVHAAHGILGEIEQLLGE